MKTHHSKEKTHDKDKDEDEDVDDVHENNTEVYSEFVFPPRAWIQVVWLNVQISVSMGRDPERNCEDFKPDLGGEFPNPEWQARRLVRREGTADRLSPRLPSARVGYAFLTSFRGPPATYATPRKL